MAASSNPCPDPIGPARTALSERCMEPLIENCGLREKSETQISKSWPKFEARNSKSEASPKSEVRNPKQTRHPKPEIFNKPIDNLKCPIRFCVP